ncbi:MAG TPA: acyl-ACP--UDP-N-acetylglucosamine O-acyltransferase [Blastocatellia bacterium]|nr:acyl-ACP--UDP-N-acetylglucosamine O-acyltransferase [Blastocatellia bacterium]
MDIHSTAIVSPGARLGAGIRIGPYAVIEEDTTIGDGCEIRAHAVIKRFTALGAASTVYEGAVLGGEPQDVAFVDCRSYLRIGPNNCIREGVTMHRGTQPESATIVGSSCFIMANAHVAHNCRLGDGVIIANNVALAGHVEIQDQVFIGGGAGVHQFCHIGRLAMIGGNSKIVQDCLPFVTTDGNPGRARGLNIVGLRRAGFKSSELRKLKEAYRLLLRSGSSLHAALTSLEKLDDPLVSQLIDFIRNSSRGFCHEESAGRRQRAMVRGEQ